MVNKENARQAVRIERRFPRKLRDKPWRRSRTLACVGSSIHALAISADGGRAVSCAARAGDLRTWDLERNKCVWRKRDFDHDPSFADISADGRLVLSAGRGCRLWDFASAKLLSQYTDTFAWQEGW